MLDIRLRPYRVSDEAWAGSLAPAPGDVDFFGYERSNRVALRFGVDGMIAEDGGNLVVEVDGEPVGDVGWHAVHHGPPPHGRTLNVGIVLAKPHRGKGHGTAAQRLLAEYLFSATRIERLEASTDIENIAEQRALQKAGFTREGVLRHAQWRAGAYHDVVLYSRLRSD